LVQDLTDRYKELVKESSITSSREKQLLDQIQIKDDEIQGIK
jgi:hypothetical protein